MVGRKRNPKKLVKRTEVLNQEQILNEEYRLLSLFNQLSNVEDTIIWCAKRGLIKNFIECEKCNRLCTLHTVDTLSDGVIWRCSTCYFKCTIRKIHY